MIILKMHDHGREIYSFKYLDNGCRDVIRHHSGAKKHDPDDNTLFDAMCGSRLADNRVNEGITKTTKYFNT